MKVAHRYRMRKRKAHRRMRNAESSVFTPSDVNTCTTLPPREKLNKCHKIPYSSGMLWCIFAVCITATGHPHTLGGTSGELDTLHRRCEYTNITLACPVREAYILYIHNVNAAWYSSLKSPFAPQQRGALSGPEWITWEVGTRRSDFAECPDYDIHMLTMSFRCENKLNHGCPLYLYDEG